MLPVTVFHGNSPKCWKTTPTPGGGPVTSCPAIVTVPPVGAVRPATQRSSVVLPQPDGPTTETISCSATLNETPASTVRSP
jgi:hypothetical protein